MLYYATLDYTMLLLRFFAVRSPADCRFFFFAPPLIRYFADADFRLRQAPSADVLMFATPR